MDKSLWVVPPARLERATSESALRRSILLSYGGTGSGARQLFAESWCFRDSGSLHVWRRISERRSSAPPERWACTHHGMLFNYVLLWTTVTRGMIHSTGPWTFRNGQWGCQKSLEAPWDSRGSFQAFKALPAPDGGFTESHSPCPLCSSGGTGTIVLECWFSCSVPEILAGMVAVDPVTWGWRNREGGSPRYSGPK